ncbi:hypothetical protein [Rhizobium esperanzae]|uniref:Uncharacterized protein n=1 Tax=Rhizobium esperanzae TaxID=1967781 RepID=A0A7W6R3V3_9HYPH|nr:hypothetical protein [Rhizobium esperanzae]MBB4236328.1 hypothetical protein [Rhizobium esperanzae]
MVDACEMVRMGKAAIARIVPLALASVTTTRSSSAGQADYRHPPDRRRLKAVKGDCRQQPVLPAI